MACWKELATTIMARGGKDVNLQWSYEICRAVEKSVNRAKVKAVQHFQLVPPPAKQRRVATSLVKSQSKTSCLFVYISDELEHPTKPRGRGTETVYV